MNETVVVLAGGTGGAMLARGLLDVVGERELVVIANTGDDIEIYGAYVSPDPDLVAFWLADLIDERGWGLAGDTFGVMEGMRALGREVWFNLGDRDLALGLERDRLLREGVRLTEAHGRLMHALGVPAPVLPMSDAPVRTRVLSAGRWWSLQEYMIRGDHSAPIDDVRCSGIRAARPTAEVLEALARAGAVIVGPSNPVISIGPILELPGLADAVRAAPGPVVAVSPIVGGRVLKGPTATCLAWKGLPASGAGVAEAYRGLLDGLVADEPVAGLPVLETDLLMSSPEDRRRLAGQTLEFALGLSQAPRPGR